MKRKNGKILILSLATCLVLALAMPVLASEDVTGEGAPPSDGEQPQTTVTNPPAVTAAPEATSKPKKTVAPTLTPAPEAEGAYGLGDYVELEGAPVSEGEISSEPTDTPSPTEAAALAAVSPAPTATFPPIEVAAVKEQKDMGPVWILVVAMGVVIIILQVILIRMRRK